MFACDGVPLKPLTRIMEVIRRSEEVENVEVILHHSELDSERIRWGVEGGVYFYLAKLTDRGLLRSIIRSAVRTSRAIRRLAKKIIDVEDTIRLLQDGRFQIQTPAETELLAANLGSACEDPQQGIGLLELMMNGIEHGNLAISYDEKKDLLRKGEFLDEVKRRLGSPDFADKRVEVALNRSKELLEVVIADQGAGFNHSRYLGFDPKRMLDPNGRGVALANACLDMEFVEPGNKVRIKLPIVAR